MSFRPDFTHEQVEYLADRLINMITPAYITLSSMQSGMMPSDLMIEDSLKKLREMSSAIRRLDGRSGDQADKEDAK